MAGYAGDLFVAEASVSDVLDPAERYALELGFSPRDFSSLDPEPPSSLFFPGNVLVCIQRNTSVICISFFHHCRELAGRLLRLGDCARVLESFTSHTSSLDRSPFQSALSVGLTEVLSIYKAALIQAQNRASQQLHSGEGNLPLSALQHYFSDFSLVLPALAALCRAVEAEDLKGRGLIEAVKGLAASGPPALKVVSRRLLYHCTQARRIRTNLLSRSTVSSV